MIRNFWEKNKCLLALILIFFVIDFCMSSCKSHKNVHLEEREIIEEIINVKKKKKHKKEKDISVRDIIVEEAHSWIGTPYKYGGMNKGTGTDCSGMIMVIFEKVAEIKLPRNSAKQAEYCNYIKEKEILPGDLVFFATGQDKRKVSHVGIMIDREKFIHASSSKGVTISRMATPYFQRTFIKYGRIPNW